MKKIQASLLLPLSLALTFEVSPLHARMKGLFVSAFTTCVVLWGSQSPVVDAQTTLMPTGVPSLPPAMPPTLNPTLLPTTILVNTTLAPSLSLAPTQAPQQSTGDAAEKDGEWYVEYIVLPITCFVFYAILVTFACIGCDRKWQKKNQQKIIASEDNEENVASKAHQAIDTYTSDRQQMTLLKFRD